MNTRALIILILSLSVHWVSAAGLAVSSEGELVIDGSAGTWSPGAVIQVPAGNYSRITLKALVGEPGKEITIINEGLVVVDNTRSGGGAIDIRGCRHLHLAGVGPGADVTAVGLKCGFRISSDKSGPHALNVVDKSSDIEIDHIEVSSAGFAGFNVKDEPRANLSTNRDHFTMYNISLHHNYVHNTQGEGFYIGHTFYDGYKPQGQTEGQLLYPHVINGLQVFANVTCDTGCEGIQVGSVVENCRISDNVVLRSGRAPFASYQSNGVQVGSGTKAIVSGNFICDIPDNGLIVFGKDRCVITNNIIARTGGSGIYVNSREVEGYYILNNTLADCAKGGVSIGNWKKYPGTVWILNCIITDSSPAINNQPSGQPLVEAGNLIDPLPAALSFADRQTGDYSSTWNSAGSWKSADETVLADSPSREEMIKLLNKTRPGADLKPTLRPGE